MSLSPILVPLSRKSAILFSKTNCEESLSPHIIRTSAVFMIFKSQSGSVAIISMELSGSSLLNESRGWLDCQQYPFCLGLRAWVEVISTLFLLTLSHFDHIPSPKQLLTLILFTL